MNKYYDNGFHAVKDVSFIAEDKEFVVLVGPSGCGKTTVLRLIAGLEEISSGDIFIGDNLVNTKPPKDRDIAMV
ncbi:MAG TPA: sugar ABC transporter ATP-binding protein, partial [Candidatus Cloacimonas sp.]|nr:sugar ABC transporter ATP-binding protein [Candidatus Cloacimonas sp.]